MPFLLEIEQKLDISEGVKHLGFQGKRFPMFTLINQQEGVSAVLKQGPFQRSPSSMPY